MEETPREFRNELLGLEMILTKCTQQERNSGIRTVHSCNMIWNIRKNWDCRTETETEKQDACIFCKSGTAAVLEQDL